MSQGAGCPICGSCNRCAFYCADCINKQFSEKPLRQLRAQRDELLARLEQQLARRVSDAHAGQSWLPGHAHRLPAAGLVLVIACMHAHSARAAAAAEAHTPTPHHLACDDATQAVTQQQQMRLWQQQQELRAAQAKAQRAKHALQKGARLPAGGLHPCSQHACRGPRSPSPCSNPASARPAAAPARPPAAPRAAARQQLAAVSSSNASRRAAVEQLSQQTAAARAEVLGTALPTVLRYQALTLSHVSAMLAREQRARLRELMEVFPLRVNALRSGAGGPIQITVCNVRLPDSAAAPPGGWLEPQVRRAMAARASARRIRPCWTLRLCAARLRAFACTLPFVAPHAPHAPGADEHIRIDCLSKSPC